MILAHLFLGAVCSVTAMLSALLAGQPWWSIVGLYVLGLLVGLLASVLALLEADRSDPAAAV